MTALMSQFSDARWRSWRRRSYDAGLAHTPAVFTAGLLAHLKRRGDVRELGMFMWDFFPQAHLDTGHGSWLPAHRPLRRIEAALMSATDVAFPMSSWGADFTRAYYHLPNVRCVVVPPWGADYPAPPPRALPEKEFTVAWGGQFSPRRAVGDILAAARQLQVTDPDVVIRLAGGGRDRARWQAQATELQLTNVTFEGMLQKANYHSLLRASDLALSVLEPGTTPSFPSKTVDYAIRGLPLVAAVERGNDFGEMIQREGFGLAGPAGDPHTLATLISTVARDQAPLQRQDMGRNSRKFFERELDVKVAAQRVAAAFA